jgi:peptide/nickel transport system substrate-binding protein
MIPSMFLGSLPQKDAIQQNLTKAKAALAASGVGNQQVTLEYPSDLTINGVPFTTMEQKVQANLQAAGFNVTLSGSPTSNWLTKYRDGKMAFGLAVGTGLSGSRRLSFHAGAARRNPSGWRRRPRSGTRLRALVPRACGARRSTSRSERLNQRGFFPLMQPTQVFVATSDLKNAVYNATYSVDVTAVSPVIR